jgi:hypothetical protein
MGLFTLKDDIYRVTLCIIFLRLQTHYVKRNLLRAFDVVASIAPLGG